MNELDTKSKIKSLTVVASIVSIFVSVIGAALGYNITATEAEEITSVVVGIICAISSAIAIYGRIRATKRLK